MPSSQTDSTPEPAVRTDQPARPSRRSVLRGAAGAGAVGLAVAGGAAAVTGLTRPDHQAPPDADAPASAVAGPVMVYLREGASGEMDIFAGTRQTRLRNPALARELLRAIK